MHCLSSRQIGILDFGRVEEGSTPRDTVQATMSLAALADALGFGRYWLAEHHAPRSAWGDPITLLSQLGAATTRIRIGTGGTLLRYHDPYSVASDMALLSWIFPDRVDIGFARGRPSVDTAQHPSDADPGLPASDYAERVRVVTGLVSGCSNGSAWRDDWPKETVPRVSVPPPQCWLLGSSTESARIAAALGAAFGCTLLHSQGPDLSGITEYRARFVPGLEPNPRVGVAVAGLCSATDGSARDAFATRILADVVHPTVVGTPAQCEDRLSTLNQELDPDAILFLDVSPDVRSRASSLYLLAKVLG